MRVAFLIAFAMMLITGWMLRGTEDESSAMQFWGVGFLFSLVVVIMLMIVKVWL